MSQKLDTEAVSAAIRQRLAAGEHIPDWEWDAVSRVVESEIEPLFSVLGARAVIEALVVAKADPLIAAVLVDLAGGSPSEIPGEIVEGSAFHVDEVFTDDEILDAALEYATRIYDGTASLFTGEWGWTTLCNPWEAVSDASHLRLLRELVRRAPDDDRILWSIGASPVVQLLYGYRGEQPPRDPPDEARELLELARDDPKLARILAFANDELPYPYPYAG
jgi:hypothetical protein